MTDRSFARRVIFEPAYDKRSDDPKKNYGIHGLSMRFLLTGAEGAVQFCLYTNWQLPHVTKELMSRPYETIGGDPHWMERPMPSDLGYHSRVPKYEGQSIVQQDCSFLPGGGPCYYDGSTLNAEPVFERLLAEGDEGVWAALEAYYAQTFTAEVPGETRP